MSVLNIRTQDQLIFIEKPVPILTSGNKNNDVLKVTFDETWDCENGKFYASFYIDDPKDADIISLTRNEDGSFTCLIPNGVLRKEGVFKLGVWCEFGDKTKTSNNKEIRVHQGAVTGNETSEENTGSGNTGNGGSGGNIDLSNYVTKDEMPEIDVDEVLEKTEGSINLYQPTEEDWIDNATIKGDGTINENEKFCLTGKIPVKPNITYSVNGWDKGWFFCYDSNDNFIGSSMTSLQSGDVLYAYGTTKENTAYIRLELSKDTDLATTIENFNSSFILVEGIGITASGYGFKTFIREIGNLAELNVEHKDNLVNAINETLKLNTMTSVSQLVNDVGYITKDDVLNDKVEINATIETISPNVYYSFGEVAELTLEFSEGVDEKVNEYMFSFISGETATVLTLPSSVQWVNELTVEPNKRYEISVVDNIGLWCAVEVS